MGGRGRRVAFVSLGYRVTGLGLGFREGEPGTLFAMYNLSPKVPCLRAGAQSMA